MPNVRTLNKEKYNISKHRFLELRHYCLQYNEWKDELKYKTDTVASVEVTDMSTSHNTGNPTQEISIRRTELMQKCRVIEETAREVAADISEYIIKAATNEDITFVYLKTVMKMPCERDCYYDKRRQFYYELDKKIK